MRLPLATRPYRDRDADAFVSLFAPDRDVFIGLHSGEPIREGDDFHGKRVILASRIAGHARGGEILVSSLPRDLGESAGDVRSDEGREVPLKDLAGTRRVYAVRLA